MLHFGLYRTGTRADESELGMGSKGDPNKRDVVWGWVLCDGPGNSLGKTLSHLNWSVESFRINGTTVFDLVHTSYPSTRNVCADSDTLAGKCLKWNAALLRGGCVVFCLVSS